MTDEERRLKNLTNICYRQKKELRKIDTCKKIEKISNTTSLIAWLCVFGSMLIPLGHKASKPTFAISLGTVTALQCTSFICKKNIERASNKFDKLQKRFDVISGRCN